MGARSGTYYTVLPMIHLCLFAGGVNKDGFQKIAKSALMRAAENSHFVEGGYFENRLNNCLIFKDGIGQ